MDNTKAENGVLLYIAVHDKKFVQSGSSQKKKPALTKKTTQAKTPGSSQKSPAPAKNSSATKFFFFT